MHKHIKGSCNYLIREAIQKGLHIKNGVIILPSGRPAKLKKASHGYNVLSLGPSNKRRSFTVGRIICWLIHGEPPNDFMQVDHINRIRHDDRPENLRWSSASENALNISEESKQRLRESCLRSRKRYRGEDSPWAKLTKNQVKEIRLCKMTQNKLAKKFQVSQSTISRIQNGKSWQY